eukprot:TRINITY_DN12522_c0_g1_i1.p1 TRINITY_DN12522_c0_g1~~TRINITY_DN12522_c0_g1_i1.p1  ORF type:complete len:812 (-),score=303.15 TRINITY_DN12522_c0_g1_i1:14-2449(-)
MSKASQVSDERLSEYLKTQKNVHDWIESTLKIKLDENLLEALRNGIVLVYLVNAIEENTILKLQENTKHAFKLKENISNFLLALEEFGMQKYQLFNINDLWEGYSIVAVVECLAHLARRANENGFLPKLKAPGEFKGVLPQLKPDEKKDIKDQISRLKTKPIERAKIKTSAAIMKKTFQLQVGDIDWEKYEKNLSKWQALVRGIQQRKKYQKMVRDQSYREHVGKEILSTEQVYVKSLQTCIKVYLKPLEEEATKTKALLSRDDIKVIFSDLETIEGVNKNLLADLEERILKWNTRTCLGDVFLKFVRFLKVYTGYLQNYNSSMDRINTLCKNVKFANLLTEIKKHPDCKSLDLASFLIMPVQRVPRYNMLLRDLAKHTWATHPDFENLNKAGSEVETIAAFLNEKKKEAEASTKLLEITQHIVKSPMNLIEASRRFLREGKMDKKMMIYLFNDMVLIGRVKKSTKQIKYMDHIQIDVVEFIDLPEDMKHNIFPIEIKFMKKAYKVLCDKRAEKAAWIKELTELKDTYQATFINKELELQKQQMSSSGKSAAEALKERAKDKKGSRMSLPPNLTNRPEAQQLTKLMEDREALEKQVETMKMIVTDQTSPAAEILRQLVSELEEMNPQIESLMGQLGIKPPSEAKKAGTMKMRPASMVQSKLMMSCGSENGGNPPLAHSASRLVSQSFSQSVGSRSPHGSMRASESSSRMSVRTPAPIVHSQSQLINPGTPILSECFKDPLSSNSSPSFSLDIGEGMTLAQVLAEKDSLDGSRLELYLSREEFEKAFKLTKEEFAKFPKWKQNTTKQQLGLF